jgi:hypothetical protein
LDRASGEALVSRLPVQPHLLLYVLRQTLPLLIAGTKVELRRGEALVGRLLEQSCRLRLVLRHALVRVLAEAEVELRIGEALVCCLPEEPHLLRLVSRPQNAVPLFGLRAEDELAYGLALHRGLRCPASLFPHRQPVVLCSLEPTDELEQSN